MHTNSRKTSLSSIYSILCFHCHVSNCETIEDTKWHSVDDELNIRVENETCKVGRLRQHIKCEAQNWTLTFVFSISPLRGIQVGRRLLCTVLLFCSGDLTPHIPLQYSPAEATCPLEFMMSGEWVGLFIGGMLQGWRGTSSRHCSVSHFIVSGKYCMYSSSRIFNFFNISVAPFKFNFFNVSVASFKFNFCDVDVTPLK